MSVLFQVAIKEIKDGKKKKETIIYQCQCGYIITSGYKELLFSHLKMHGRGIRRLTSKMEEFFK